MLVTLAYAGYPFAYAYARPVGPASFPHAGYAYADAYACRSGLLPYAGYAYAYASACRSGLLPIWECAVGLLSQLRPQCTRLVYLVAAGNTANH